MLGVAPLGLKDLAAAGVATAGLSGPTPPTSVQGLVLVAARSGSRTQGGRRVLLAWGAPVTAARAAGLACGPATAGDQIPGRDPVLARCPVLAKDGWAVEIPETALQLAPTSRSALYFTKAGMCGAELWLDSAAQITTARRVIAGVVAAGVGLQVTTWQLPGGRLDDYVFQHVQLSIFGAEPGPGGYLAVSDGTIPAGPLPVAGQSVPRIRAGSRVQPPRYPARARRAGIAGNVKLRVTLDERGSVAGVEILRSPDQELAQAAEKAVRQWQFTPARLAGRPVRVVFDLTVPIKLPTSNDALRAR